MFNFYLFTTFLILFYNFICYPYKQFMKPSTSENLWNAWKYKTDFSFWMRFVVH